VSAFFPVFLDLRHQSCVVIGGGPVAERKARGLLGAGAVVTVVAPDVTAALGALAEAGTLTHVARRYRSGDLAGHRLAFVATDDPEVTDAVADEAREWNIFVNAADDAPRSDFILPAVLTRGPLTVAVGTGGASPALARLVRRDLEAVVGDDYGALVEVAADVRRELRDRGRASTGDAWLRSVDAGVRGLLREGRRDEARARLLARLEAES
jgi:siroheme synthase-like protein